MSGIMATRDSVRGNPGLKALREMAGLNRQQMARAVGVAPRMWQRYENEGRLPEKLDIVLRIAVLSGKTIDETIAMIGFELPDRDELLDRAKSLEA